MSLEFNFWLRAAQRGLLTWSLVLPVGSSACGGEDSPATSDQTADDATDDSDDSVGMSDAGRVVPVGTRDAGAKPDAGTQPRDALLDAGRENDAGGASDAGRALDASGVTVPSGGGFIRGDAPSEASASKAGPYKVMTYTNGYRAGEAYADSTIHYPSDAQPPFAIITIVPGFVSPQASIQSWGPFLASHGIVAMTIGTVTPADPPQVREVALMDALKTLESENTREGSPLQGKLDLSREAVGGWSMGGGGTLLAAEHNAGKLKAAMAICPWNPAYSYAGVKVPSLMFAGTLDALAGGQSQGFYESIPESTPKLLWEVTGADHWYANDPAGQSGAVGRYGLSFLKVFLEGDERYRQFLKVKGPGASDFRTNM